MKNPRQINRLLASFAKRHGIKEQLTAHGVVESAQEELMRTVAGTPLENDLIVLSYADSVVTFACKNAAARFDAQGVADEVCRALASKFPALTLRAQCVLRPEAWKRIMH
jgi:hypothetical protein